MRETVVQDFLEASPYYDMSGIPVNTYKNKAPFTGKIISTKRVVGAKVRSVLFGSYVGRIFYQAFQDAKY